MQYVILSPGKLKGTVAVPSSKSISHRAVICAGLSEGTSKLDNINYSQDIDATCGAMKSLGANIIKGENSLEIRGANRLKAKKADIDCIESGSTLRFMIPIAALTGKKVVFRGEGELADRPLGPYYEIFADQKISYKNSNGKLPLTIDGNLKPGEYRVNGSISSQFISGLLFALPLLEGDSKIAVTSELESKPYVDLTIDTLKDFSVQVENREHREFIIKGNQKFKARNLTIESDFSQAAFWLAAGTLGAEVECKGMNIKSLQGDKAIIEVIEEMGGSVSISEDIVKAIPSATKGIVFDASDSPDLVPVIAVLGSLSEGTTEIINAKRLRIKECDRLKAMCRELRKIGADIEERDDGLIIRGKRLLKGGAVNSWGDHRIAMALAVASIKCKEPVIIRDALCVRKSYPDFWSHYKMLGGEIDEWSVGEEY
ncbi:MAG: 3-phosphoshikimate 1-carboxyvinyltransferase [Clostridiaceae bacterium]